MTDRLQFTEVWLRGKDGPWHRPGPDQPRAAVWRVLCGAEVSVVASARTRPGEAPRPTCAGCGQEGERG